MSCDVPLPFEKELRNTSMMELVKFGEIGLVKGIFLASTYLVFVIDGDTLYSVYIILIFFFKFRLFNFLLAP